jgi:hypothetical protein
MLSLAIGSGCGSIHIFMKPYDFALTQCEHMGKVTSELSTSRFNMPSVMTKSDDFVSVSNKLSWLKMLDLLSIYQRCEELPHLFMTSTFPRKWHILYFG